MSETQKFFFKEGFLPIKKLVVDPEILTEHIPKDRMLTEYHSEYNYFGEFQDEYNHEIQVPGSFSRTCYPAYKNVHDLVMETLEKNFLQDIKLFPTYWFDRLYYPGIDLKRHTDWIACDVSVTLQVSTTLKQPWTFYGKTKSGKEVGFDMENGDAVLYAGHDIEHWREPMPGEYGDWHHQMFLHYVVMDSERYNELVRKGNIYPDAFINRRKRYRNSFYNYTHDISDFTKNK